jgi:uncharacterized protein (TIGR03663 family)
MNKGTFCGLFLVTMIAGVAFRLGRLDLRPMHHDEANQAIKFSVLLETREYRYDRNDHHGPTLYYLTLPSAWIRGQKTLAALDERTLRAVPLAFGAGVILLFLFLAGGLGREAVVFGALFAALSPALAYYSRFYIQESLFVFFSLGFLIALGRYILRPHAAWALAAGTGAGLAYATKETSILVFAASGAALLLSLIWNRTLFRAAGPAVGARPARISHVLAGLTAAAVPAILLYSSFFKNPSGILDSLRAFQGYAIRGIDPGLHAHPWFYYLQLLVFSASGGLVWTEGMILILAVVGMGFALRRGAGGAFPGRFSVVQECFWLRYLLLYSLCSVVLFSTVRYKTPWNLLPFHIGFVLLAGIGAAALLRLFRPVLLRVLLLTLLLAGVVHLGIQNWRANYLYPADPRNPYVYAQTSPDFLRLVQRIHDLAAVHPRGKDMLVKVIAGPYEQWPLPWYLRDFGRVGYWTTVEGAGGFEGVPIVIASHENAERLGPYLRDRFQAEFYGLRPDVLLTLYIDRPLWERFLQGR